MAITTRRVVGPIVLPDGSVPAGGRVIVALSGWDREGGQGVMAGPITILLDEDGVFDADLWCTDTGENGRVYTGLIRWFTGSECRSQNIQFDVPSGAGDLAFAPIWVVGDLPPSTQADALAQAKAAAAAAASSAEDAETYALAAESAAALLEGFAAREIGTFETDSAVANGRGPYALPYNPVDQTYMDLSLDGLRQAPGRDFNVVDMPSAVSGYGVQFTYDLPSGLTCDYALVRPLAADPEAEYLTLEEFGVVGNATGDQGPAITTAIAAAAGRKLTGKAGTTYRITTPVVYTGSIDLDLSTSRVVVAADITPFVFKAAATGPFALSADYAAGSTTLSVTGLSSAPKAGQVVWIASRARDPGDRDNGSSSQQYRVGEAFRLGAGSTTTSLVLQAPLAHSIGIDPTSSAGDEARVPAYTTALDTRLALIDMDARCNISLPVIEYEAGHEGDGWAKHAVEVRNYFCPLINHGGVSKGYGPAVRLWGTYAATVESVSVSNLTDNSPSQLGYGVVDAGWGTKVVGLTAHNVRHAYTTSKSSTSYTIESLTADSIATMGRTAGAQIVGGIASGGVSAAWDTHQDAQDTLFSGNTADGCGADGFAVRGRNITIANPIIRNCGAGIRYFTEYDSGDPDDDIYNNGKLLSDFTSGLIDSPQMDVRGRCIDVRAATVVLAGAGRYRTQSDCLIYNSGGTLAIGGAHRFVVDGSSADANSDALIHIGANTTASALAFPQPNIVIDGVVEIDARLWTGPALTAIKTSTGTKMIVRGILRLLLPAGATLFSGGDTGIVCEGAGRIEYVIEGAAGIVTGLSARPIYLVDLGSGAIMDGTDRRKVFVGYNQLTDATTNSLIVRHSPAGSSGLRLRGTNTAVGDGQDQGGITFETNDASNTALDAARVLFRGNGSLGFVDTVIQRCQTAGTLLDALIIRSNGNIDFFAQDGATVGLQWNAANQTLRHTPRTVASLPSASTAGAGARAFVSDASAPTFGATVTGGGAVNAPVYSDGTNWRIG